MLYLDYFFLFMGMNAEPTPDGTAFADPTQYLFLMKDQSVKSKFKLHTEIVFFDKNVDNMMGNKYLLSLGYDDKIEGGKKMESALVFKIWEFVSLDDYVPHSLTNLTGGTIWEKPINDQQNKLTPVMFKIEVNGIPYVKGVKKFSVSKDLMWAALVTQDNSILVYKLLDRDNNQGFKFMPENRFRNETRPFTHLAQFKDVIDLFIFKN